MRKLPQSGHGHGYISVLLVQVGGRRSIRLTTRSARRKILALISPHHITSHPPTQKGPRFGAPEISTTCCGPGPQKRSTFYGWLKCARLLFQLFQLSTLGGFKIAEIFNEVHKNNLYKYFWCIWVGKRLSMCCPFLTNIFLCNLFVKPPMGNLRIFVNGNCLNGSKYLPK